MMRHIRWVAAATALIAVGSLETRTLSAQEVPSPYRFLQILQEAGPFIGHVGGAPGTLGLGSKGGTVIGARYGVDVSGPFGLEGVASWYSSTRDVVDPRKPEGSRSIGTADVSIVTLDGRIRFGLTGQRTWHGLSPSVYAGGGVGFDVAADPPENAQLASDQPFDLGVRIVGVLGTGVRWMMSDRLLVRGDANLALWQLHTPNGFFATSLNLGAIPRSEWVNNGTLSVGLAYRF